MTRTEATADGFVRLLKAMPKSAQSAVITRIARDEDFSEDILDLAIIAARRHEPSRPLRQYLAERQSA